MNRFPPRIRFLVALFILLSFSSCVTKQRPERPASGTPLTVVVSVSDRFTLRVKVTNTSSVVTSIDEHELPWEGRYSLWTKAFEEDAFGSPLEEAFPPSDAPLKRVVAQLNPGDVVAGEIDLRNRFPDLQEVLKHKDVIIFWRYAPRSPGFRIVSTGAVTIPKQN